MANLKCIGLTVLILATLSSSLVLAANPLDAVVKNALHQYQPIENSGFAIAVIKDGKVIFKNAYGYRDREKKLAVTTKTLFALGSSTKSFTSMALKIAEARGLIDFNQPVKKYVPELAFSDATITDQATLVDLLAHRTGLPRHDALWYLSGFNRYELIKRISCLPFQKKPTGGFRHSYVYNNLLVTAAGVALERVSGKTWEEFVQDNILNPIGMRDSGFAAPDFSKDFAQPYLLDQRIPYKDYTNIAPAAALISNVDDLSLWVLTQLAHGVSPSGATLLSRAQMDSMYLPANKTSETENAGLGWFIDQFAGTSLIVHQGDSDGYHAYVSFIPSKNLGLVAISNQHINDFPDKVAEQVYRYLMKDSPQLADEGKKSSKAPLFGSQKLEDRPTGLADQPSDQGNKTAQNFENSGYGVITLTNESGKDYLSYGPNKWRIWRIPFLGYLFYIDAYAKRTWVPFYFPDGARGFSLPLEPTTESIYFKLQPTRPI